MIKDQNSYAIGVMSFPVCPVNVIGIWISDILLSLKCPLLKSDSVTLQRALSPGKVSLNVSKNNLINLKGTHFYPAWFSPSFAESSLSWEKLFSPAYLSSDLLTCLAQGGPFKGTAVVFVFVLFLGGDWPYTERETCPNRENFNEKLCRRSLIPAWASFSLFQ